MKGLTMGSFNVGCGMSSLTIHYGDPVGFVLLGKSKESGINGDFAARMRVHPTDCYQPFLPPVFGIYDDYGNLADLKPSATVDAIEAIFDRPALDVVNAVGNSRDGYSTYDEVSSLYMPKELVALLSTYPSDTSALFDFVGFEETEPFAGETLAYLWREYRISKFVQVAAGAASAERTRWITLEDDSEKPIADFWTSGNGASGGDEVLSKFFEATGKLPGFPEGTWEKIVLLRSLGGMFFHQEVYEKIRAIPEEDYMAVFSRKRADETQDLLDSIPEELTTNATLALLRGSFDMARGTSMLVAEHFGALRAYAGNREYESLTALVGVMTALNRELAPALYGSQEGNDEYVSALNEATSAILKLREEEYS